MSYQTKGLTNRSRLLTFVSALFVLLVALVAVTAAPSPGANGDAIDTAYVNGRVLLYPDANDKPMSTDIDWAEAVGVTDGVISYVGDSAGIQEKIDGSTNVIDLKNKMMMPGVGDGHLHGGSEPMCNHHYEGGTIDEILSTLKACLLREDQIDHLNSNYRLTSSNFMGDGILPEGTYLDRHVLDRLSKDPSEDIYGTGTTRPIVVRNMDAHKSYTNTQAIINAGLDETTPDPTDGFIGRDPDNYPNGQFSDYSANWGPNLPAVPDGTFIARRENVKFANSIGITMIFRPGGSANDLNIAKRLADDGDLTVRMNQGLSAGSLRGETDPAAVASVISNLNANRAAYDGYTNPASPGDLRVDTVKMFCDGVPEYPGQTAAMLEPYRINIGTEEEPNWVPRPDGWRGEEPSCEDATLGFVQLDRNRWNIHSHSLGDRSTRVALDNYEEAAKENPTWNRRHVITHLEFVDKSDIPRFGKLGVVASMSGQWNHRNAWHVQGIEGFIAPDRMNNMYPTKGIIDGGAVVAQGSDWPVTDLVPWAAIEQMVTREGQVNPAKAVYPGPLNPGAAITLEQALKVSTIGVAYQLHRESDLGSIEVGKLADLIVIDSDPYNPPGGELQALEQAGEQQSEALRDEESAREAVVSNEDAVEGSIDVAREASIAAREAQSRVLQTQRRLSKSNGRVRLLKRAVQKAKPARKKAKRNALKRAKKKAKRVRAKLNRQNSALIRANKKATQADRAVLKARASLRTARDVLSRSKAKVNESVALKQARQKEYDNAKSNAVRDVHNTKVLYTIIGGDIVHSAENNPLE